MGGAETLYEGDDALSAKPVLILIENGEIIKVYVKIAKSKNGLFKT